MNSLVKAIAFYLPQFHPIAENDKWWSKGFTEWSNVCKATPLFYRHYQPRIPADLGFYDLRVPETRSSQAALAKQYGIFGFCYYHYWFNGKLLLQRPLESIRDSGSPNYPFCMCWANESWSRTWIGDDKDVLIEQTYSDLDDSIHGKYLASFFKDPRYIKVDQRPLLLIYRPLDLPSPAETLERFAFEACKVGLKRPFFVGVDARCPGYDLRKAGFDITLAFSPQLGVLGRDAFNDRRSLAKFFRNIRYGIPSSRLKLYSDSSARRLMNQISREHPFIPATYVSWDNTPRKKRNGIVFMNGSPRSFGDDLRNAVKSAQDLPEDQRFVFINGWNEWAEGNHLEPDLRHGHEYLRAVGAALAS